MFFKQTKKLCKGECNQLVFVWARGMCKLCDAKANPKVKKVRSVSVIAKISFKRKKEMAEYLKLRLVFLEENRLCQARLVGCTMDATDCHHSAGRCGSNYLDVTKWKALCRNCHKFTEENPRIAKELGLSVSRLANAE
jgi:hypothetical protein